ncbi:MFS transporter [candidate division KSB1 bacterium]|nr:MFS transporter [candidate division KSB1 bacterium]
MPDTLQKPPLRATISWILYDFANTAYSMNIVTLYFATWITMDLGQNDSLFTLLNSLSMIPVALTMPVLGDWSDYKGKKLLSLFVLTLVCILGVLSLGLIGFLDSLDKLIPLICVVFIISNYSYQGGLVFYNALMPSVSTTRTIGRVSGYGTALGYFGAVAGLIVARLFVEGHFFGVSVPYINAGGSKAAFLPTAILFLVFAIPIFIFVKEPALRATEDSFWRIKESYGKVTRTLFDTKKYPGLLRFLFGRLLYEDSMQTVIMIMGLYLQKVVGFTLGETQIFLMLVIPFAIIGSALCGILTDHYGPHKMLIGVIIIWICTLVGVLLSSGKDIFWLWGGIVGALLGSTQTAARPLLISLVPQHKLGEFFGLYSLSGKVAAVIGPLVWSIVIFGFSGFGVVVKYKAAVISLTLIMAASLFVLIKVPDLHKKIKSGQVLY